MAIPGFVPHFVLLFSSVYVIAGLSAFGYLFISRTLFARALLLVFFTMGYNTLLKSFWQMPLPPENLAPTWGFPSGHMHAATVFWGYLAVASRITWVRVGVAALLPLIGYFTVSEGYHYPIDIYGAVGFALISIGVYHYINTREMLKNYPSLAGIGLFFLVCIAIFLLPSDEVKNSVAIGSGGILGFTLGWTATRWSEQIQFGTTNNISQFVPTLGDKIRLFILTALGTLGVFLVIRVFPYGTFPSPELQTFVLYFLLTLWVSISPVMMSKNVSE